MIDEVTDWSLRIYNGLKILNADEWFFKVHWKMIQICQHASI